MAFSPQGRYFAWINGSSLKVVLCETWQVVAEISRNKVQALSFSSQDTYLMTWEPFIGELRHFNRLILNLTCSKNGNICSVSQANPQGSPNLCLWDPKNGNLVKSFIYKKQVDW